MTSTIEKYMDKVEAETEANEATGYTENTNKPRC